MGGGDQFVDMTEDSFRLWDLTKRTIVKKAPVDVTPVEACLTPDGAKVMYLDQVTRNLEGIRFVDLKDAFDPATPKDAQGAKAETARGDVSAGKREPPIALARVPPEEQRYSDEYRRLPLDELPAMEKATPSEEMEPIDLREQLSSVGFSDDGRIFAAGGQDGAVFVGNVASRKATARFRTDQGLDIVAAQPSPDGSLVASGFKQRMYTEIWTNRASQARE